ncbi:MAG: hypothetical protein AAF191_09595, partial [Verrucomicrobiota bacterium]
MSSWNSRQGDEREQRLQQELAKLRDHEEYLDPVPCHKRAGLPVETFWGKAWCQTLEGYADFADRMPQGRALLRKGAVLGLVIDPGDIFAYVTSEDLHEVLIKVSPLSAESWLALQRSCSTQIPS